MKYLQYIYAVAFIFFPLSCEQESDKPLTCNDGRLLSDFTIQLSNYFDQLIGPENNSSLAVSYGYWDDITRQNSGEKKITYYESLNAGYLPNYSSIFDKEEVRVYTTEYVLSLDSVLKTMDSSLREHLLSVAIDKHRKKFGVKDTTPFNARRSGILLILSVLQHENAHAVLDKICGYCSKYNLNDPVALSANEGFNKFLMDEVSDYLSEQK